MRSRLEIPVAVFLLVASGWGVWTQIRPRSIGLFDPTSIRSLGAGEALDPDIVLRDADGVPHRIGDLLGRRATVFWAWSTSCPCVKVLEPRMKALERKYREAGIRWVAIAGEPGDLPEAIRRRREELHEEMPILLDPTWRVCRRLGFDRATVACVVDADGYVRFRGSPTDHLYHPTADRLASALPVVLAGGTPETPVRTPSYGCSYSDPGLSCPDALGSSGGTAERP